MRVTLYKSPNFKITVDDSKLPQGKDFFDRWDKGKRAVENFVEVNGTMTLPNPIETLWKKAS